MTATLPETRATRRRAATTPGPGRWPIWFTFLLIAGYALFCHGCHGDEDNELWARSHAIPTALGKTTGQPPPQLLGIGEDCRLRGGTSDRNFDPAR